MSEYVRANDCYAQVMLVVQVFDFRWGRCFLLFILIYCCQVEIEPHEDINQMIQLHSKLQIWIYVTKFGFIYI